jgi:ankyrin repeat protein
MNNFKKTLFLFLLFVGQTTFTSCNSYQNKTTKMLMHFLHEPDIAAAAQAFKRCNDSDIVINKSSRSNNVLDSLLCIVLSEEEFYNDLELLKLLISYGADANTNTFMNYTPLMIACSNKNDHVDAVKILIEEGNANYNTQGLLNQTPLMRACFLSNLKIVEYLLSLPKIDIALTNTSGKTALDIARDHSRYTQTKEEGIKIQKCIHSLESFPQSSNMPPFFLITALGASALSTLGNYF